MRTTHFALASLLACALGFPVGCATADNGSTYLGSKDAAGGGDGPSGVDVGAPGKDSGAPPTDSGILDSAKPPVDTGAPPLDSGTPPPTDTGAPPVDSGTPPPTDTGTSPPVDSGTPPADGGTSQGGTTGQACSKSTDCDVLRNGVQKCTADTFAPDTIYPTPVCIGTTCPLPDPSKVTYCDGTAGFCLASGTSNICLPACVFGDSTAPPTGCIGHDVCNFYAYTATPTGFGYCFGGCTTDGDCASGICQTETGLCLKATVTYSLTIGTACTQADAGSATAAAKCDCLYATSSGKGYCSQFCTMGGASCPSGFTCDASLPKVDPVSKTPLFSSAPTGLAGSCLKNCAVDSDCTALGGYCEQMAGTAHKTCQIGPRP